MIADLGKRLVRDRLALLGLVVLVAIGAAALLAPWLTDRDPLDTDFLRRFEPPSREHPLGTDQLGRDLLARLLYGARYTLGTGLAAMALILLVGTAAGLAAGLLGGRIDALLMRIVDVLLAFPSLILALAIVGMLGPSLTNVLIGIAAVGWASYARIVRGQVLSLREREFVEAAHALGAPRLWVARRHILPHVLPTIIVLASLDMGNLLLAISALSFLGVGAQAPTPEWGRMLNDARPFLWQAPHLMLFPGLAIFLVVLAFNFLGDGLRDLLDPRMRR
jgi:peptide/nickel transport system permease protein